MNKKIIAIIGIIIYAGLLLFFLIKLSIPRQSDVSARVPKIEVITPETIKSAVEKQAKSYKEFGIWPVTIDKSFQGKDNPFVP